MDETCQNGFRQEAARISSEPEEQVRRVSFFKRVAKLGTWFWPHITDADSAKKASKQGYWACAFCVGTTLLFVGLGLLGKGVLDVDLSALLDVLIFMVIGWGIYKMNRVAAVAGLMFYLFERISVWAEYGLGNPGITAIVCLMFVNSVRGTLEYHKYRKETGSTTIA
jgi:hypothetical protein